MRLPTTSRSRPRRIVSTSGSSGTIDPRFGLLPTVELSAQLFPRRSGRRRLRLLLRTTLARAPHGAVDAHLGEELLGVIGPFVADGVARKLHVVAGHQPFPPRLVILSAGAPARAPDAIPEPGHDDALRFLPTTPEGNRTQHGPERARAGRRP